MSVPLAADLEGVFVRRWKRFVAEVRTRDGAHVTPRAIRPSGPLPVHL